jgi:hemerythrin superfamily protein
MIARFVMKHLLLSSKDILEGNTSFMPNPIQIIKEDHETIKGLFTTYNGLTENDEDARKETASQILKELAIHARMEEKFFYPRIKEAIDAEHPVEVDDAIQEHHAAKVLMLR